MELSRLDFLLKNGGPDLVRDVMQLFLDKGPSRMAAIRDAAAAGDPQVLEAAAHALRSSAIQVGFNDLGELCLDIEKRAGQGEAAFPPAEMEKLVGAFDKDRQTYQEWSEARKKGDSDGVRVV